MPSWGLAGVVVCMLCPGRVSTHVAESSGRRNGPGCDGEVGPPCCKSGCDHSVSNLRLGEL